MATPEYRTGDTWKPITGTVTDGDGNAVDISTAHALSFTALEPVGPTLITGTPDNLDDGTAENKGRWSYTWGASDLSVSGTYAVQIPVTWDSEATEIESFPSNKANAPTFLVTESNS